MSNHQLPPGYIACGAPRCQWAGPSEALARMLWSKGKSVKTGGTE